MYFIYLLYFIYTYVHKYVYIFWLGRYVKNPCSCRFRIQISRKCSYLRYRKEVKVVLIFGESNLIKKKKKCKDMYKEM